MKRRPFIASVLATLAGSSRVLAQTPASKIWRIGVLSLSVPAEPTMLRWIYQLLARLGYVEGRNLQIDFKFAQGRAEDLPKLAAELVSAQPDLLIGLLINDGLALKRATTEIPIVMMYATLPVEMGLIKSLAEPGGNITGTTSVSPDLWARTFQILRELIPQTDHVATIYDPSVLGMAHYVKQTEDAAGSLGIFLSLNPVRTAAEIDSALPNMMRNRPNALNVGVTGVLNEHFGKIIEFGARQRMPSLYSIRQPVAEGGLISYSPHFGAMGLRNAWMIDKIFKGAAPADLPFEEPSRFLLSINLKTARAMGLEVPTALMLRADEVIE